MILTGTTKQKSNLIRNTITETLEKEKKIHPEQFQYRLALTKMCEHHNKVLRNPNTIVYGMENRVLKFLIKWISRKSYCKRVRFLIVLLHRHMIPLILPSSEIKTGRSCTYD